MSGPGLNSIGTRIGRLLTASIVLATILVGYVYAQGSAAEPADDPGGVGTAEAEARILGADLGGKMEAALGDAFGGVWFDPSSAQLHVGVTSPASRQRAEATAAQAGLSGLVTETPVDSTWGELTAAQKTLNRQLGDLFARGQVRTSALPDTNSVTVELASAVTASRRATLRRQASGTGVDVSVTVASAPDLLGTAEKRCRKFETKKAHCDKPIVAGVRIDAKNGTTCTAGPAIVLQDQSTAEKATATYILTAGHCIASGGKEAEWFALTKEKEEKKLIGKAVEGLNGEKGLVDKVDVGVIKVNKPGEWVHETEIPVTPGIAEWKTTEEIEPTPVTAQAATPVKGTKICVSGQISGKSCGSLFAPSVTVTFEEEDPEEVITKSTVETLVEVEGATTGGGTSGGPWYLEAKPGEALGTHVGAGIVEEAGKKFERKWYQPLAVSFANLATQYQLLTTANEKRKHP